MFPLTIAAIDKVLFRGDVRSVTAPGTEGLLTVLRHHAPLITALKKGTITFTGEKDEPEMLDIEKGFLAVHKKEVIILVS